MGSFCIMSEFKYVDQTYMYGMDIKKHSSPHSSIHHCSQWRGRSTSGLWPGCSHQRGRLLVIDASNSMSNWLASMTSVMATTPNASNDNKCPRNTHWSFASYLNLVAILSGSVCSVLKPVNLSGPRRRPCMKIGFWSVMNINNSIAGGTTYLRKWSLLNGWKCALSGKEVGHWRASLKYCQIGIGWAHLWMYTRVQEISHHVVGVPKWSSVTNDN